MDEVIQSPNRKIPQTYHEPEPIKHSLKMFEISTSVGEPGGRKRGPLCSLTAWCRASERWRPPKGGIPGIKNIIFCFFVPKRKKNTDVRSFKAWFWFTEWEKITMPAHYSILRQFQGPMLGTPYCRPPSPPHVWIPLKSIFSMLGIFLVNDSQTPLPSKTTIWDFCRFVFYTFEDVEKKCFRHQKCF